MLHSAPKETNGACSDGNRGIDRSSISEFLHFCTKCDTFATSCGGQIGCTFSCRCPPNLAPPFGAVSLPTGCSALALAISAAARQLPTRASTCPPPQPPRGRAAHSLMLPFLKPADQGVVRPWLRTLKARVVMRKIIPQGWRPDARQIGSRRHWPTAPQAKGYGAPSPNCGLRFPRP
jgi:hypothetical protein